MIENKIEDLYQEIILEHNKNPFYYYKMKEATHYFKGHNSFCGDKIEIFLKLSGKVIDEISFYGEGCAICKASASMMVSILKGLVITEALDRFEYFHNLLNNKFIENIKDEKYKDLNVFEGVRKYPIRIKCAILAWHTMKIALKTQFKKKVF